MTWIFSDATAFNSHLWGWDVSRITDMSYTFNGASAFHQKLSDSWSISTATDERMFNPCPGVPSPVVERRSDSQTGTQLGPEHEHARR